MSPSGKLYYHNQMGVGEKNRYKEGWWIYRVDQRSDGGHTALLTGQEDLSSWTTEELRRGRKGYQGKPPAMLPTPIANELTRRTLEEARQALQDGLVESISELVDMAAGRKPARGDQIRAINIVLERVMGKSPETVTLNIQQPWQKVLNAGISRELPEETDEEDDIIDAEVVDDDDTVWED